MSEIFYTKASTASSTPKANLLWKLIEEIEYPFNESSVKTMKYILGMMKKEKMSEIPDGLLEKLMKLSRICTSVKEKSNKGLKNQKKSLQLFYALLKKVASIKYVLYGCFACNKVFKTRDYLQSHIIRRHQGSLVKNLSLSLNSHLTTWQTSYSTPTLDLTDEINELKEQQQEIKRQLENKLKELEFESPKLNQSININHMHNRSYKSIETVDFQNFLREISSKPSSPPTEDIGRNPQDLLFAAQALEIDPVVDSHYLYIAKRFLDKPLPKNWKNIGNSFTNIQTGETISYHPGIKHYKKVVKMMKHRKAMIIDKVKEVLKPQNRIQENKYKKGIQGHFWVTSEEFVKKKDELCTKLDDQIQKLGRVTMKMLVEIDKESSKIISSVPGYSQAYKNVEKQFKSLLQSYLNKT